MSNNNNTSESIMDASNLAYELQKDRTTDAVVPFVADDRLALDASERVVVTNETTVLEGSEKKNSSIHNDNERDSQCFQDASTKNTTLEFNSDPLNHQPFGSTPTTTVDDGTLRSTVNNNSNNNKRSRSMIENSDLLEQPYKRFASNSNVVQEERFHTTDAMVVDSRNASRANNNNDVNLQTTISNQPPVPARNKLLLRRNVLSTTTTARLEAGNVFRSVKRHRLGTLCPVKRHRLGTLPFYMHLSQPSQNGRKVFQSKPCGDAKCPVCDFDAFCKESLWIHLHACHDAEFCFQHKMTEDGTFHILVERRSCPDTSNASLPETGQTELIHARAARFGSSLMPSVCAISPLRTTAQDRVKLPLRQYYHGSTQCTLSLAEWIWNAAADNDIDESWQQQVSEDLIDEFTDVSAAEKTFFKLWNRFMASFGNGCVVAHGEMPEACVVFIRTNANVIRNEKLEEPLVATLLNLWEESHISQTHLYEAMQLYAEIITSSQSTAGATGSK